MKSYSRLPLILALIPLSAPLSLAEPVPYSAKACVPASAERIYQSLIDYKSYVKLKGAEYRMSLSEGSTFDILPSVPVLRMISVFPMSERQKLVRPAEHQNAAHFERVIFVLQPAFLGESEQAFYPRFVANCNAGWIREKLQFVHQCALHPSEHNYAVKTFESKVSINEGDSFCAGMEPPATLLEYTFTLESEKEHVTAISERVLAQPQFEKLFSSRAGKYLNLEQSARNKMQSFFKDERTFLKNFFKGFYDSCIESLK